MSQYDYGMDNAILNGHLDVIIWLKENTFNSFGSDHCVYAVIYWHNFWQERNPHYFTPKTLSSAAEGGHFEIFKWLRNFGYAWNVEVCAEAAKLGNIQMLQWARKLGCPWDESVCAAAALGDNLTPQNGCAINNVLGIPQLPSLKC